MSPQVPERYSFGGFTLDVTERRFARNDTAIHLPPKAFDILLALVRHAGQLVLKSDLLTRLWPDAFVEEGVLTVYMSILRKELGDSSRPTKYIETVHKYGYRFIAPVGYAAGVVPVATHIDRDGDQPVHPLRAIELVRKGRKHLLTGSYFELRGAADAFEAAIDLDAAYAPAHAGLALTRCALAQSRAEPALVAYEHAKGGALRALALDDRSAEAQLALATVLFISEWDWLGTERSLRRALDINPEYAEAYVRYGNLLDACGRFNEGMAMKLRALEHAPTSTLVLSQIALSYWCQRKYDETMVWAQRALDRDPKHATARIFLALALWKSGRGDEVAAELVRQAQSFGISPDAAMAAAAASAEPSCAEGDQAKALTRHLMQALPAAAGGPSATTRAMGCANRGEMDAAFHFLDQALAERDANIVYLAVAPQWDSLRADPRFADRLRRLALPQSEI